MKEQAVAGDKVKVVLVKKEYIGTLLETPEFESGIALIKLGSGYNIGLNKKDILDIKILKKGEEKIALKKIKNNSSKPNIAMIITGGTIAARLNSKKGGVDWLDNPESLFKFYPNFLKKSML